MKNFRYLLLSLLIFFYLHPSFAYDPHKEEIYQSEQRGIFDRHNKVLHVIEEISGTYSTHIESDMFFLNIEFDGRNITLKAQYQNQKNCKSFPVENILEKSLTIYEIEDRIIDESWLIEFRDINLSLDDFEILKFNMSYGKHFHLLPETNLRVGIEENSFIGFVFPSKKISEFIRHKNPTHISCPKYF